MARTSKQLIGNKGEKLACIFLSNNGYEIIEQNFRYKRAEVDIIAKKESFIIFIEVKTRKNNQYGNPEEFVSERKQELFHEVAEYYLEENVIEFNLRFDIISVMGEEIEHFKDAF